MTPERKKEKMILRILIMQAENGDQDAARLLKSKFDADEMERKRGRKGLVIKVTSANGETTIIKTLRSVATYAGVSVSTIKYHLDKGTKDLKGNTYEKIAERNVPNE